MERLLDSYCFLLKTPLAVYYPRELPATTDNLKPFELDSQYGDTARLEPLNFPFYRIYCGLRLEYGEAYKEWDKNIVMRYYNGDWKGTKLFHSYLGLWEMTYPLCAGGQLLGVLYSSGQIVVKDAVANWRDALEEIANEVVWDPTDGSSKIPEKSNQVQDICSAIDKNKDIQAKDKNGLKELLRKAAKDKGVIAADLVGRYGDFKNFGKTLESALEDLYAAKAEAARREHISGSSKEIVARGDQLSKEPEQFWNELDKAVKATLPDIRGYVLYELDEYKGSYRPAKTCVYDKEIISGEADFRNFCRNVFDELHEKGKRKESYIAYDLLDEDVPQKLRDLFQRGISNFAGGAITVAIPSTESNGKITGGLVCVCTRSGQECMDGQKLSKSSLIFYIEALEDIMEVSSMVLARHAVVKAQFTAWAVRSHELIAPIHALKGYQDNLAWLFRNCVAAKLASDIDTKNTFVTQLARLGMLCDLLEHIAKGGSFEGAEYYVKVNFEKDVLLPIVQPLRDYGKREKKVDVGYEDKIRNVPELFLFTDGIRRCMFNLIFNAIKYSNKKSEVVIELQETQDNYEIHIINKGIGVPKGEEQRIFQMFTQGSNADQAAAYGAGLGLPVAREMARKHKGDVKLISGAPERTIFALILPKSLEFGPPRKLFSKETYL